IVAGLFFIVTTAGSELTIKCIFLLFFIHTGGAQIIDMMMLVVDVVKGMQTQTAECLVIGEILCEKMVVVLNKVDLIPEQKRQATIEKMTKRMLKTLENTKFANSTVIAVAANVGASEITTDVQRIGMDQLITCLQSQAYIPTRNPEGSLLFSVDHCFSIRGQGTVMTGTVLNGSVSVNDNVEIPILKETKKVKSMQMFRKPVKSIVQGDRAGICVTQFDPKKLERGVVCSPGFLPTLYGGIVKVHKIPYFKGKCLNKAKFHITVGHETVMGKLQFFGKPPSDNDHVDEEQFSTDTEYEFQEELNEKTQTKLANTNDRETQYVMIEFDHPVIGQADSLVIGSRLDTDINLNTCRLAFYGRIVLPFLSRDYQKEELPKLKIFKWKSKEGTVERMADEYSVIVKSLFKKETNLALFTNMKVKLSSGDEGTIEGSFGQSGKIKVRIPKGLADSTKERLSTTKKGKGKQANENGSEAKEPIKVLLEFKKYIYDSSHKMIQT
uniref:Selenocysteine-specific elongation factor n=2 Tax=Clytia hemisphaerica TaxID=252671 RepID=A0A7M5VGU5_9CNID